MARAIWTGSIGFGLVSIPVRLYSATQQKDIGFHQFERGTGKRVRYERVAEGTDREVDYDDIVKGYEVSKDEYVLVEPEELEAIEPGRSRTIEITDFVDLDEIDPIYFEKTYFLGPEQDTGAERPYALLHRAMTDRNKIGICTFVMRGKQYLASIRPYQRALALETMYYPDEVRSVDEIENPPGDVDLDPRQLEVAEELVESLSTRWNPSKYNDEYRARVLELIEKKAKGQAVVLPERAEEPRVRDLMEALRRSVEAARKGERPKAETTGRDGGRKRRGGGDRDEEADLLSLSREELDERARRLDIKGRSKMSKQELAEALKKAS
jgi:DNA end-binding protein Ku